MRSLVRELPAIARRPPPSRSRSSSTSTPHERSWAWAASEPARWIHLLRGPRRPGSAVPAVEGSPGLGAGTRSSARARTATTASASSPASELMQAASDIFLGWLRVEGIDGEIRDYYVRQLHDWKGGADVERPARARRDAVRPPLRSDARPRARTLGRPDRDRLVPRQGRRVRPGDRGLRSRLRRPERARLRSVRLQPSAPGGSRRRPAFEAHAGTRSRDAGARAASRGASRGRAGTPRIGRRGVRDGRSRRGGRRRNHGGRACLPALHLAPAARARRRRRPRPDVARRVRVAGGGREVSRPRRPRLLVGRERREQPVRTGTRF